MLGVVVVLSGVLALTAARSVNYCGARMCGNTDNHTFCQYPEGPSDKCEGYLYARLGSNEKKRILDRINGFRRDAAAGIMKGFPPAANMMKMHWVEELAREAQRWADQCRPPQPIEERDTCRDLYSITVGQCVASVMGTRKVRVEEFVDIWYIQSVSYAHSVRYYVPPSKGGKYYGDFAQMIWSKSYMVGCGRSRFMAPWKGRLQRVERLVCNIAPAGPQLTHSLWIPGPPAHACPYPSHPSQISMFFCDYRDSDRELKEALDFRERDFVPKKRIQKKVRRELSNDTEEEMTTIININITVGKTKGNHPVISLIKLIPSMADYNLENYPEDFKRAMAAQASTACRAMSSIATVLYTYIPVSYFLYIIKVLT